MVHNNCVGNMGDAEKKAVAVSPGYAQKLRRGKRKSLATCLLPARRSTVLGAKSGDPAGRASGGVRVRH